MSLDNSRTNFRHRNIDWTRPLAIYRDIILISKKEDYENSGKPCQDGFIPPHDEKGEKKALIEKEVKRAIESYEKKKNIVIPKTEVVDKSKNPEPNGFSKIDYVQTIFDRPRSYIVYSDRERQQDHEEEKYEADISDKNFLERHESMKFSTDDFEEAFTALERDVNGQIIPEEKAQNVLCEKFGKSETNLEYKEHFKQIYKVIL